MVGAVLVSQSTFRILSDLYALRLDIFRLFLWSVATAVVLSLLVSATITVPVRRLSSQARAILDPRGRLVRPIMPLRARDEVGDLSRSLGELTARLARHVHRMEAFASDVSHEFKNPLASIRSAAELALASHDRAERTSLLSMVLEDVSRMERLLSGVREISRIDSGAAEEEATVPVDAREIACRVVESARRRSNGREVDFRVEGDAARVWVPAVRIEQVVENLVDNAASFSPPGGTRARVLRPRRTRTCVISVCDDGPGIPPEHAERIFDRFFSFRPGRRRACTRGWGCQSSRPSRKPTVDRCARPTARLTGRSSRCACRRPESAAARACGACASGTAAARRSGCRRACPSLLDIHHNCDKLRAMNIAGEGRGARSVRVGASRP